MAVSSVKDFTQGGFQEIIDDTISPDKVNKLVFCSGKIYYELLAKREELKRSDIAIIRIEQLFPLHRAKIKQILSKYKQVKNYVWAQEEPLNMGAWSYMLQNFNEVKLDVVAQKPNSAPASGSSHRFKTRHQKVINKVFN